MSDQAQHKLGQLLTGTEGRDAVHIALAPVIAGERIEPGQHIGFVTGGDTETVGASAEPLGIADPFLCVPVEPGGRFWMWLYPNTISGLRHSWTHEAFPPEAVPAAKKAPTRRDKAASEAWLRDFIASADCPDYDTVIDAATGKGGRNRVVDWGQLYLHFNGLDAHGDIPPEFWVHLSILTGKTVPKGKRATAFSCSC